MLRRTILWRVRGWVSLGRRARVIATLLPPRLWYPAAARLARLQWAFCRLLWWRPDISLRNAVFLDLLLLELMRYGTFPIRWKVSGAEHLPDGERDGSGVLYCTAHLPLFAAQARVLCELGKEPSLVVALAAAIGEDGRYPVPGLVTRLPALPPGAKAMVRAKRELQNGGVVGSLMDAYSGGPLMPQIFRLAGKVGARSVMLLSELDRDNAIKLSIVPPPFPFCETEERVQANLAAFEAHRRRILKPFGYDRMRSFEARVAAPRAQVAVHGTPGS